MERIEKIEGIGFGLPDDRNAIFENERGLRRERISCMIRKKLIVCELEEVKIEREDNIMDYTALIRFV